MPCQLGGSIDFKYERNLKMAISIDRFTKKTHHVVKKVTKVWFQIESNFFRFFKIQKFWFKIEQVWNENKYSNKIDSVEMPNDEHQAGFGNGFGRFQTL